MKIETPKQVVQLISEILTDSWAVEHIRLRDQALISLCAKKLEERGHPDAAKLLREMARQVEIP